MCEDESQKKSLILFSNLLFVCDVIWCRWLCCCWLIFVVSVDSFSPTFIFSNLLYFASNFPAAELLSFSQWRWWLPMTIFWSVVDPFNDEYVREVHRRIFGFSFYFNALLDDSYELIFFCSVASTLRNIFFDCPNKKIHLSRFDAFWRSAESWQIFWKNFHLSFRNLGKYKMAFETS